MDEVRLVVIIGGLFLAACPPGSTPAQSKAVPAPSKTPASTAAAAQAPAKLARTSAPPAPMPTSPPLKELASWLLPAGFGHSSVVGCSPTLRHCLLRDQKTLRLWQLGGEQPPRIIARASEFMHRFGPRGRLLAVASLAVDRAGLPTHLAKLFLLELKRGRRRGLAPPKGLPLGRLSFSPDGQQLATVAGDRLALWRTRDGRSHGGRPTIDIATDAGGRYPLVFSPNGRWLSHGGWVGPLALVNLRRDRVESKLAMPGSALAAHFTPANQLLLASGSGLTALLWSPESGRPVATLTPPKDPAGAHRPPKPTSPQIRTNGEGLVAIVGLQRLLLWQLQPLKLLVDQRVALANARLTPDLRLVVSCKGVYQLKPWRSLARLACSKLYLSRTADKALAIDDQRVRLFALPPP